MSRAEVLSGRGGAVGVARPDNATDRFVPARAADVMLLGAMAGSGYRSPPSLVRRADGQMIQLTTLLYLVLEAIDGHRNHTQIADLVSTKCRRAVSAGNIEHLVTKKLRPLGLVRAADGSEPRLRKSSPLLGLQLRHAVTDPRRTRQITRPFAGLFRPFPVLAFLGAFLYVCWWLFFEKGLASAAHEAFYQPGLLLVVFGVTVLSAGFHEFGHAAAARYGGSTPGTMGMGFYLFWPAFYTDVTDSYRLGRGGRIRTDLGGLYFNAVVAVITVVVSFATGYDALLLVVATQILQMTRQLLPTIRFDGYHLLADLTGVPDLYHHIKPTLKGMLPWRWRRRDTRALKPWAQAIITLWCLTVVPLMVVVLTMMVVTLPRLLATAWASAGEQWARLTDGLDAGDLIEVMARGLAILALALPMLGLGLLLCRLVRSLIRSVWRRTSGKPAQRAVAVVTAAAVLAGLAWAWWPDDGRYRPINPDEGGTITDLVSQDDSIATRPPAQSRPQHSGYLNRTELVWPAGVQQPTRRHPALAFVMVPRTPGSTLEPSSPTTDVSTPVDPSEPAPTSAVPSESPPTEDPDGPVGGDDTQAPPAPVWVFPFDKPLPPDPGDNQALAVNTTDNTVVYDIAFALVWIDDSSDPVTNTNEAHAYASCSRCAAVAIGFQVVLVVGSADIVVPQNLAGALNYNCVQCLTYALATQLVLTLERPLSADGMTALNELWAQIADFGRSIEDYPLADLRDMLSSYEEQILGIIAEDKALTLPDAPDASNDPSLNTSPPTSAESQTSPVGPSEPTEVTPSSAPTTTSPPSAASPEPTPTTSQPSPTDETTTEPESTPSPTTSPTTPEPTTATPTSP